MNTANAGSGGQVGGLTGTNGETKMWLSASDLDDRQAADADAWFGQRQADVDTLRARVEALETLVRRIVRAREDTMTVQERLMGKSTFGAWLDAVAVEISNVFSLGAGPEELCDSITEWRRHWTDGSTPREAAERVREM